MVEAAHFTGQSETLFQRQFPHTLERLNQGNYLQEFLLELMRPILLRGYGSESLL